MIAALSSFGPVVWARQRRQVTHAVGDLMIPFAAIVLHRMCTAADTGSLVPAAPSAPGAAGRPSATDSIALPVTPPLRRAGTFGS